MTSIPTAADLFTAIAAGDVDRVEALLVDAPGLAVSRDDSGKTPLHRAFMWPAIVARLLTAGADPNALDKSGERPIHPAAKWVQAETLRLLIAAGASVNGADAAGVVPLDWAIRRGREDITRMLLAAGADPASARGDTSPSS